MGENDKVSDQMKEKIIDELITKNKIDPRVFVEIQRFKISDYFGWTPNEIDEMKAEDINIYMAIIKGIGSGKSMKRVLR